ncbi:hypothetical protein TrVE_jg9464 [Triparma verrucosa]|uniref:SAP domain-containing protein n=1 Tax=Triparma verrucosa TaxID=1606542 RepID=A0A9W7C7B4_9STRA|nr:hypothetical protein TrVE_jg9464 [Triparma verrucosa]
MSVDYTSKKVPELKSLLKSKGLSDKGVKANLIHRLQEQDEKDLSSKPSAKKRKLLPSSSSTPPPPPSAYSPRPSPLPSSPSPTPNPSITLLKTSLTNICSTITFPSKIFTPQNIDWYKNLLPLPTPTSEKNVTKNLPPSSNDDSWWGVVDCGKIIEKDLNKIEKQGKQKGKREWGREKREWGGRGKGRGF